MLDLVFMTDFMAISRYGQINKKKYVRTHSQIKHKSDIMRCRSQRLQTCTLEVTPLTLI